MRDIVLRHDLKLIGIQVSIGNFYQGPLYLYLLIPFFIAFHFNPLAGAVGAVTIAVITMGMLVTITQKFFGKRVALCALLLFALSPEFIQYGATPLYQHFQPLFLLLCLWAFLSKRTFLLGLFCALVLEMHFLAFPFVVALFVLQIWNSASKLKEIFLFLLGLLPGLSPTIVFELRHSFLNVHAVLGYLHTPPVQTTPHTVWSLFSPWVSGLLRWFGAAGALVVMATFCKARSTAEKSIWQLLLLTSFFTLLLEFKLYSFEPHYLLPVWILLLFTASIWISKVKMRFGICMLLILCLGDLYFVLPKLSANHGYNMPLGWSYQTIMQTAAVIAQNSEGRQCNVASLLDGDTRTYPLRYALEVKGVKVESVESYPQSNCEYVVARRVSDIVDSSVWEITSLKPYTITNQWVINENVVLTALSRATAF